MSLLDRLLFLICPSHHASSFSAG